MYDFVFDRLRAIRQDMVIQRINSGEMIQLLEPIVRFYVYAEQRYEIECLFHNINLKNKIFQTLRKKHLRI